jgi:hypothetical protein
MSNYLFLVPVGIILGLGGFVAFWCLIVKMLSLKGWQRLAQYQLPQPLGWPHTTLGQAWLGGIRYRNVIKVGAQAQGLSLESMFMFRIGHPPLLIPWSAIGPVLTEKSFWGKTYATDIRTSNGDSVRFEFSSDRLAEEMQAWRAKGGH